MRSAWVGLLALLFTACQGATPGEQSPGAEAALGLTPFNDVIINEGGEFQVKVLVLHTGDEAVKLTVEGLPDFGTFSGDTLIFRPGPDSARESTVLVRATAGTASDSQQFTVKVLPFHPAPPPCNTEMEAEAPQPVAGGRHWKRVKSNTCQELYGVWGSSGTDVWAVGAGGTILHWDGEEWTPFSSPTDRDLRAISGSGPDNIFAVGGREGDPLPTIVQWDGTVWKPARWSESAREDGPDWGHTRGTPRVLRAVHVWPQGAYANGIMQGGLRGGRVEWNGSEWRAYGFYMGNMVNGIGGFGDYVVWEVGPGGQIVRREGTASWNENTGSPRPVNTTTELFGVWAATPEDVWTVGEQPFFSDGHATLWGAIAHRDAVGWSSEQRADWPLFRAVWGASATDVWAVGLGGLAHWDGGAWTPLLSEKLTANAIWGASATDAWMVGPGGRVLHLELAP
ncbi:MAG: hypothetical protein JXB05_11680 [Myxococcaceae bacterium]|nr:hypothetical protein [Myxococcaceae bacterium]